MSNFTIGQRVVCVEDGGSEGATCPIKRGEVYTVRNAAPFTFDVCHFGSTYGVWLEGVNRHSLPRGSYQDLPFGNARFRPVAEKPASMDILRAIVADPLREIPDDPREPKRIKTPEEVASIPGSIR